ncbi:MAG: sensor histidine kinase [Deltaproteobacteria bacterium]|nr:sensor histidine kinase [Deltaproteobacteria bacterium]
MSAGAALACLLAAAPAPLPADGDPVPLGHFMTYLEDKEATFTAEDVQARRAAFRHWADDQPRFGFTRSAYWLRVTLRGDTRDRDTLLELTYPLHDEVLLHASTPDGPERVQRSGLAVPFAQREIPDPHLLFPVHVPAGVDVDLLMRVRSQSALLLAARLWDREAFARYQHHNRFWKGLLYGVLLAAVLYSLAVWWTVRDPSHTWFVGFLSAVMLLEASLDGTAYEYLWPGTPWLARHSIPFFVALTALGALVFTRSFMTTAVTAPRHDRWLLGVMALDSVVLPLSLVMDYLWAVRSSVALGVLSLAAATLTALECRRRHVVFAGVFLLALGVLFGGVAAAVVGPFFSIPSSPLTEHGLQVGSAVVALMFTMGLGQRLSAAERATREAQQALNRRLEEQVAARTVELEQKNRELADLNVRKDALVATVSHDFRSPLATIRQNVQTLLRDLGIMDEADARQFLEAIGRQEARLTAMCTNLLDLARLRGRALARQRVDLVQVARSILDTVEPRARAAGVSVALHTAQDVPHVLGEGERLEQLLQNLVDNALRFTPRGGRVDVHVEHADGKALLRVADTGCGIPHQHLGQLFEPFFQVPSQSHAGQGSGLGLAIVAAVAQAHGGRVDVDSAEGRGTTFRVEIPAA